jgi:hypothetical protein
VFVQETLAMKEEIQRRTAARQQHTSVFLQELLWEALKKELSSPS